MLDTFKSLVMEEDKKLSLGRISYWIVLGLAVKIWWKGSDIGTNLLYFLMLLLVYSLGKKGIEIVKLLPFIQNLKANGSKTEKKNDTDQDG